MSGTFLLVAVLICPVVMGTAMLLMWREMRRGGHGSAGQDRTSPVEPAQTDETPGRHA
jgi:hypothetical protein